MGALTQPIFFRATQVVSGDVLLLEPRGLWRWIRRPLLAIVDVRDRSVPYLVHLRGQRVWKVPLDGAPFSEAAYAAAVYRLPGIDKARASAIAARAAERPGEGVHHPDYDCGRTHASGEALAADAYRVIGVELRFERGTPAPPLARVRGPQDPPNAVAVADAVAPVPDAGGRGEGWIARGVPRTLPWQQRGRR